MPDAKKGKGKHNTRNLLIVGGAALVIGVAWFWWQSRQAASAPASGSSGSTAGTSATGGTDMGDIVQTVQGPPGQAGKQGKAGKQGQPGKTAHDCPAGMRWDFAQSKCVKAGVFGKARAPRPPVKRKRGNAPA